MDMSMGITMDRPISMDIHIHGKSEGCYRTTLVCSVGLYTWLDVVPRLQTDNVKLAWRDHVD